MPRKAIEDDVADADSARLSERDSLRVLDLLENPPAPNARLLAAARALPQHTTSEFEAALRAASKL
jgi:uncharacterized protein (DUF1778 family)